MSALTLADVTAKRGARTVLHDIDTTFSEGKLTALIGPNGAGKSTLLDIAAGLLAPVTGLVRLGDTPIRELPRRELARRRAYLPQRAGVDWPISVERVVALGLTPSLPAFGGVPEHLKASVRQALDECDLLALADRPATNLSGGELARVMLARAIVGNPETLIVDEPTAGLDPRHALDALGRLRARADAGRTVVMAIHEVDLALRFADDVVAMREGRIVASGPAETVMTEAMLSDLYEVRVRVRREDGASIHFSRGGR